MWSAMRSLKALSVNKAKGTGEGVHNEARGGREPRR